MDKLDKIDDLEKTQNSTYYQKNKNRINRARRKRYKITHKRDKTKAKKLNPNDIKRASLYTQINFIHQLLNQDKTELNHKKKVILELNDLLELAYDKIAPNLDYRQIHRTATTRNFARPFLAFQIAGNGEQFFWQIEREFKDVYSKRQLRRALNDLLQLKWIVRLGRGDMTIYRANPFLEALNGVHRNWLMLCYYTQYNIDFFDLLNIPLLNASKEVIINSKIQLHEYNPQNKPKPSQWVCGFFEGFLTIKLTAKDGGIYKTYLPVNRHASSKIIGYNPKTKERLIDPIGNVHHTIPLKWELFDVKESVEFARKGRATRWAKDIGTYTYVHFDNSFKLLCFEKINNSYRNYQYLVFKKPFEKLLAKVWSRKSYNCQYMEVSDFDMLQRMFTLRFVDGKRRSELFDGLGIHYAKTKKAPYAN